VAQVAAQQAPHATLLPTDLPNPLPLGAHRVISTLAAAQMRKMMEGVVLFGTGKQAQLNGYSSGGKTGTAQKIDPVTRTYSKTMHIASFAGFAPVNNPIIAVAVVIDSPKGAYYGAEVSAPVFAEVAQQVLEYLGVEHDIDLRPVTAPSKKEPPVTEDDNSAQGESIQALYDAANDLPSDDPLHPAPVPSASASSPDATPSVQAANTAAGSNPGASPAHVSITPAQQLAQQTKSNPPPTANAVVIADAGQLRVPSLIGLPVRKVIEQAGAAGFEVVISGNGTAREQAPAPGAMVPTGTKIVARCAR
jgi:cell division protein FtsI (penicillin-binding protein 3)